ncbi:MAG TPA: hypothetical protein VIO33_08245 [Burkholderiaceae bacterium]
MLIAVSRETLTPSAMRADRVRTLGGLIERLARLTASDDISEMVRHALLDCEVALAQVHAQLALDVHVVDQLESALNDTRRSLATVAARRAGEPPESFA